MGKICVPYDILIIWEGNITEVETFVKEINIIDHSIQFKEEIGSIVVTYLGLNIKINNEKKLEFYIFRKEIYSSM